MRTRITAEGHLQVALPLIVSESDGENYPQEILSFDNLDGFYEGQLRHEVWRDWIRRLSGKDAK